MELHSQECHWKPPPTQKKLQLNTSMAPGGTSEIQPLKLPGQEDSRVTWEFSAFPSSWKMPAGHTGVTQHQQGVCVGCAAVPWIQTGKLRAIPEPHLPA